MRVDVEPTGYRARIGPSGARSDSQVNKRGAGTWVGRKEEEGRCGGQSPVLLDPKCQLLIGMAEGTHTFLAHIVSSPTRRSCTQCPRMR
jgi:hypothetical protein